MYSWYKLVYQTWNRDQVRANLSKVIAYCVKVIHMLSLIKSLQIVWPVLNFQLHHDNDIAGGISGHLMSQMDQPLYMWQVSVIYNKQFIFIINAHCECKCIYI